MPKIIPIEVKERWPKMYKEGLSLKKIGSECNCSYFTVASYLNSLGLKTNNRVIDKKIKDKWPKLYLNGLSCGSIAKKFNCHPFSVYYHIKKSNIKTNIKIRAVHGKGFCVNSEGYLRCTRSGKNLHSLMHRLIMEKHLGRKLAKEEIVHHIDGNKKNNDIQNLQLFSCTSDHIKFHAKIRKNFQPRYNKLHKGD